ncbi:MAG TPA: nucleotide sugar dehydrogenase [Xanthobacteraceae bacterium]|jgi:UDPglucose 6-dehydrogenase|nr:nucleotide sugar dehydrogenase [Xanthobacteraceae bacterium]
MTKPVIGYAGMTHLGLVSASAAAAQGFRTIAFDTDAALIGRLQKGDLPVNEPDLPELIARHKSDLVFSADVAALGACDVVYVAVDVPTDDQALSDLTPIGVMVERVKPVLGKNALLVILSQVPPGYTRALTLPPSQLYYQVETLVFGRAIERATKPERFIVGCADPRQPIAPALKTFLESFGCPLLPMAYESAELAKISINFCLVASIAVANTLAEVCERVGANWSDIAPALKLDKRIGPGAYLSPGLGIAGGNLERDLRTIVQIGETKKTDVGVVKAWLANSLHRKDWPWRMLQDHALPADATVAVLGLAYKENTHSIKNSPSLAFLEHLRGRSVQVHDPVVPASVAPWTKGAADPLAAASGADVLVIATPWPQYRELRPGDLAKAMKGKTVLDPYRVLDGQACAAAGLTYHTLGMPPLAPAA